MNPNPKILHKSDWSKFGTTVSPLNKLITKAKSTLVECLSHHHECSMHYRDMLTSIACFITVISCDFAPWRARHSVLFRQFRKQWRENVCYELWWWLSDRRTIMFFWCWKWTWLPVCQNNVIFFSLFFLSQMFFANVAYQIVYMTVFVFCFLSMWKKSL